MGERSYRGNAPDPDLGWVMIRKIGIGDELWMIFRQAQAHSPDWANYKIVSTGLVKRKANYWLARNDATGQIGFSRDFAMMREHRPRLHTMVERVWRGEA